MESRAIRTLRVAAAACTDCPLYARATQAVFGTGPAPAPLMLVGEQPGDREDRAGTPFVGPAGVLLDEVLEEVGIDRSGVYLTNAVKHFKWRPGSGKVRLHQSPSRSEVAACAQWWQAELDAVAPDVVVTLGAVATKACSGPRHASRSCTAGRSKRSTAGWWPPRTRPRCCGQENAGPSSAGSSWTT